MSPVLGHTQRDLHERRRPDLGPRRPGANLFPQPILWPERRTPGQHAPMHMLEPRRGFRYLHTLYVGMLVHTASSIYNYRVPQQHAKRVCRSAAVARSQARLLYLLATAHSSTGRPLNMYSLLCRTDMSPAPAPKRSWRRPPTRGRPRGPRCTSCRRRSRWAAATHARRAP